MSHTTAWQAYAYDLTLNPGDHTCDHPTRRGHPCRRWVPHPQLLCPAHFQAAPLATVIQLDNYRTDRGTR